MIWSQLEVFLARGVAWIANVTLSANATAVVNVNVVVTEFGVEVETEVQAVDEVYRQGKAERQKRVSSDWMSSRQPLGATWQNGSKQRCIDICLKWSGKGSYQHQDFTATRDAQSS